MQHCRSAEAVHSARGALPLPVLLLTDMPMHLLQQPAAPLLPPHYRMVHLENKQGLKGSALS